MELSKKKTASKCDIDPSQVKDGDYVCIDSYGDKQEFHATLISKRWPRPQTPGTGNEERHTSPLKTGRARETFASNESRAHAFVELRNIKVVHVTGSMELSKHAQTRQGGRVWRVQNVLGNRLSRNLFPYTRFPSVRMLDVYRKAHPHAKASL